MSRLLTVEQLRCLEVARILREGLPEVEFSMSGYCGMAACIGGHAVAHYSPAMWQNMNPFPMRNEAKRLLGLKERDVGPMFAPWYYGGPNASEITPEMAAATLSNFALTGKVEWAKT